MYPGWVLHGFHFLYRGYSHPTLSLSTSWAPLGSHMVSRDGRGYTPRGPEGKVPTIVDLLQGISLSGSLPPVRNSRVTSNEKRSWVELLLQTNG